MIKLKISETEAVSVSPKDIDFVEYHVYWNNREEPPGLQIFMKDGKTYKVHYALEFKELVAIFKKYKIKLVY